jgi:hypothetical protein
MKSGNYTAKKKNWKLHRISVCIYIKAICKKCWDFISGCWVLKHAWGQRSRLAAGYINVCLAHTWKIVRCWWKNWISSTAHLPNLKYKIIYKILWSHGMWGIVARLVGRYQGIVGFLTTLFKVEEKLVPWKGEQRSTSETTQRHIPEFGCSEPCHGMTIFLDLCTLKGKKHEVASKRQTLFIQQHNVITRNTYNSLKKGCENLKFRKMFVVSTNQMVPFRSTQIQEYGIKHKASLVLQQSDDVCIVWNAEKTFFFQWLNSKAPFLWSGLKFFQLEKCQRYV